jgi:hypothetical protein
LQLKKQNTILTNRSSPKPLPFIFNQHQHNSPITLISTKPYQHNRQFLVLPHCLSQS